MHQRVASACCLVAEVDNSLLVPSLLPSVLPSVLPSDPSEHLQEVRERHDEAWQERFLQVTEEVCFAVPLNDVLHEEAPSGWVGEADFGNEEWTVRVLHDQDPSFLAVLLVVPSFLVAPFLLVLVPSFPFRVPSFPVFAAGSLAHHDPQERHQAKVWQEERERETDR